MSRDYEFLIDHLNAHIKNLDLKLNPKNYGIIMNAADGIACVAGLEKVSLGEVVSFLEDGIAIVMGIEKNFVNIMLLNRINDAIQGVEVFASGHDVQVPVGNKLLGRVINALGHPLDDNGIIEAESFRSIEAPSPGIMDRACVCQPLQTGIKIIDALVPIGLGQKQLILGDRQSGKTTLVIDTILSQRHIKDKGEKFTYCIYVAIGKKNSDIAKIYQTLKEKNAMEYTIIIAVGASDSAGMHYIAPMSGAAIAEYFRDNGENALVIFDDLTKHADAYREICLLMKRTPAREAYPGDIFYLHARLLERAVNMIDEKGGGSVTMLPIIETKAGDVSDYIPTSVISITDGQIYLDKELFLDGQKPGINIGLSVSRIGSAAQYKAMQKIAGRLKGELAQFREYEAFARSVADLDQETQTMLNRGRVLMNLFKQSVNNPSSFEKMIIILFAGIKGLLDNIEFKGGIEHFENALLAYMNENEKALMEALNRDHTFDDALEKNMTQAIKSFLDQQFKNEKALAGAKI